MSLSTASSHHRTDHLAHPRVWLLTSHKIGDNNQVLALAEALGWPHEQKRIVRRENRLTSKLIYRQMLGITLAGIDRERSSTLAPPWPDLVISASRANEMVARWIARMSGGHTRIVHMGRPKGPLDAFDLVITTPQYFLPPRDNVLEIELPLHRVSRARLRKAGAIWRPRLACLPHPRTAVLVGGNSGKLVFGSAAAARLGRLANALAETSGGSLLVTNSARTPPRAFDALLRELTAPAHVHYWNGTPAGNPYYGFLAVADRLIVTAESTSMLAEACATGKPVFMFDFSDGAFKREDPPGATPGWFARLGRRVKPRRFQRDIGNIHRLLIERGRADWLTGPVAGMRRACSSKIVPCDLQRAAARVRQLFHRNDEHA